MKLIQKATDILCCHRALYVGMSGTYGWASAHADQSAVYLTLAVLHAILAIRG